MTEGQRYRVKARRNGEWWALIVPGVPGAFTEVRRLDQAQPTIREVISRLLEVPQDSFDVEIVPDWRW
jgi:hypothetical protein